MRKILTHLIYFILIGNIAYAQSSDDVLFNYLNKINLENKTAIIEAQTKIGVLEETTTIEALIQLHEKCLVAAQKIENDSLSYRIAKKMGHFYNENHNFPKAEECANLALTYLKKDKSYQQLSSNSTNGIIILLALFFGLLLKDYYKIRAKNKRINKQLKKKKKTNEKKIKKLSQIDGQKTEVFTNIAHELQTPLSIINGYSEQLLKSETVSVKDKESLEIILKNGNHLLSSIYQMLEISASDKQTHPIPLDHILFSLQQLIDYILPNYQFLANKKNIQINVENFDMAPMLYSNVLKIETILNNLLSNAIKYTKEGGVIHLTYLEVDEKYHQIEVRDNGKGISETALPHLFKGNYQSNDAEPGNSFGIGLSICKEYIESLSGTILVKSQVGVGSVFTVNFPKNNFQISPKNNRQILPDTELVATNKPKIPERPTLLIVEDNIDWCKYLETILKDDYNLVFVHDGNHALIYLKDQIPHLIITDWMMQGINGITFVEQLKLSDAHKHIPLMMLTARSLVSDKIKALRVGIDDYLVKSVTEELLKKRIHQLIVFKENQKSIFSPYLLDERNEDNLKLSHSDQAWLLKMEEIIFPLIKNFDLNIKDISTLCNMDSTTLNRKIKAITGQTAKRYIQEIRYWEARRLLETGVYDTVKAVGFSVGFKDIKYFSQKFKERFGKYPSSYIKAKTYLTH